MRLLYDESGAILVMVLAVLLILAIAVTALVGSTRTSIALANRVKNDAGSNLVLDAGFSMAVVGIQQQISEGYSPGDQSFIFNSAGDPTVVPLISGDSLLGDMNVISVYDELSKININQASKEELLRVPGISASIADAILDWRDVDNAVRSSGAESNYYRSLAVPYSCKNAPFESVEELLLVRGITPDSYRIILPYVTVYGDGKININTCSQETLVILSIDESLAQRIIALRHGPDGTAGTGDDVVFSSAEDLLAELKVRLVLDDDDVNKLTYLIKENRLGVRSEFYRIVVSTDSSVKNLHRVLTAVVELRNQKPPGIRFWSVS